MATTRMETISVARARGVTEWQSVIAVLLCCLAHGSCVEVTGPQSLLI